LGHITNPGIDGNPGFLYWGWKLIGNINFWQGYFSQGYTTQYRQTDSHPFRMSDDTFSGLIGGLNRCFISKI